MTEQEQKGFPVGCKVRIVYQNHSMTGQILTVEKWGGRENLYYVGAGGRAWNRASSLELVQEEESKSEVDQWFDDNLVKARPAKKEWEPDKGIEWEKHKQFMKSL